MIINSCDFVARMIIIRSRRVFSEDNFCLFVTGFVVIRSRRVFCERNLRRLIFSYSAVVYFSFVFKRAFLIKVFPFWLVLDIRCISDSTIFILNLLYFCLNAINISGICDSTVFALISTNSLLDTINRRFKHNGLFAKRFIKRSINLFNYFIDFFICRIGCYVWMDFRMFIGKCIKDILLDFLLIFIFGKHPFARKKAPEPVSGSF